MTGFPGITADYNGAIKDADFKLLGATVVLVLLLLIAVYRSPMLALVPLIVVGRRVHDRDRDHLPAEPRGGPRGRQPRRPRCSLC